MKARFTRAEDNRFGIRFEPENFEEQLLLEIFTRDSISLGHEFQFSSFEHNARGREGLTSCWGQLVKCEGPKFIDTAEFVECTACISKPGSPTLCAGCLSNRATIARLAQMLREKGSV